MKRVTSNIVCFVAGVTVPLAGALLALLATASPIDELRQAAGIFVPAGTTLTMETWRTSQFLGDGHRLRLFQLSNDDRQWANECPDGFTRGLLGSSDIWPFITHSGLDQDTLVCSRTNVRADEIDTVLLIETQIFHLQTYY
jgi:hypothetical protein